MIRSTIVLWTMTTQGDKEMEFLYPVSRQFPFDETCEKIVRSLEARSWTVPGIVVKFDDYGSGEAKYRLVRSITGEDFKLYFCRVQRRLSGGRLNDTAAVNKISIPGRELWIYEEESGPTLYEYVGDNWERDRSAFFSGSKVNSRLNCEPRLYLKYNGACDCSADQGVSYDAINFLTATLSGNAANLDRMVHTHRGLRSPLLVHDGDYGREYDPQEAEPHQFVTATVMNQFNEWLKSNVLSQISNEKLSSVAVDISQSDSKTPWPDNIGPLFAYGTFRDAKRIRQGKEDPGQLAPCDRFALEGNGLRLVPYDIQNDGSIPEAAYEGFLWCGVGKVSAETDLNDIEVPGDYQSSSAQSIFQVMPLFANDIYIADQGAYDARRQELVAIGIAEKRDVFTSEEVTSLFAARARTFVPICEYVGGYNNPVVLVARELGLDEVEVINVSPHPDY